MAGRENETKGRRMGTIRIAKEASSTCSKTKLSQGNAPHSDPLDPATPTTLTHAGTTTNKLPSVSTATD